ncbi:MAG: hypothetical protein ACKN9T_13030 [Candidatus Methylumidiphilus sp.]
MKPTRRDYCQFLLSTQINYTQTYLADYHKYFSHDAINRYLREDKVPPSVVWLAAKDAIRYTKNACIIFDDSVLDKRHSFEIELVRRQYSGNAHGIIKGSGSHALVATGQTAEGDFRALIQSPRGRGSHEAGLMPARGRAAARCGGADRQTPARLPRCQPAA